MNLLYPQLINKLMYCSSSFLAIYYFQDKPSIGDIKNITTAIDTKNSNQFIFPHTINNVITKYFNRATIKLGELLKTSSSINVTDAGFSNIRLFRPIG